MGDETGGKTAGARVRQTERQNGRTGRRMTELKRETQGAGGRTYGETSGER